MNPFSKIRLFYKETKTEVVNKTTWPKPADLRMHTAVVIVAVFLLALFVSVSDFALTNIRDLLTEIVRSGSVN